jgi:hypothetical protein
VETDLADLDPSLRAEDVGESTSALVQALDDWPRPQAQEAQARPRVTWWSDPDGRRAGAARPRRAGGRARSPFEGGQRPFRRKWLNPGRLLIA